eukprot:CAMPEP_0178960498 /NCGR_PEP_ID=MMETSP0789-20121207/13001_1 /TAXON_ID=3005 /ORGANISM="Rhizosolenia setigera, Strain CCMP 1694" /LENGTH=340 /DNA_ID=CAMNT_0020643861 /DNA_START=44 /DNA_END=1066 /DNA_ORIENTATION=+
MRSESICLFLWALLQNNIIKDETNVAYATAFLHGSGIRHSPSCLYKNSDNEGSSLILHASINKIHQNPPSQIESMWGIVPNTSIFPKAHFPHGHQKLTDPPILELPDFLSLEECQIIKSWALEAIDNGAEECDEYLNARVNSEVEETGSSQEGQDLLGEFDLDEKGLLSASDRGGFRIRLDENFVKGMLRDRLLTLLRKDTKDKEEKETQFVFEEGQWIRPTPHTIVIRDQTVVFYGPGNGVPPHVDGKDFTLLVYLSDVPEGVGGRTVFPEDNFSQTPKQGTALLYRSKDELLHYSEAMTSEDHDKWIMQLLIDYNHDYKAGDLIVDYKTGQSYVWDGK